MINVNYLWDRPLYFLAAVVLFGVIGFIIDVWWNSRWVDDKKEE